ncbi:MAG: hypothetical protein EA424_17290 [Planctomycetaceae bacterium]|nr:MAG: hypothetical protein EA424_17290 [Planctomycetaceae bacterium]
MQTRVLGQVFWMIGTIGLMMGSSLALAEVTPMDLAFTRQAARRMVFDARQEIPLWSLRPAEIVGLEVMHPAVTLDDSEPAVYSIQGERLKIQADQPSHSAMWVGGMNPFASCVLQIEDLEGYGMIGFDLASPDGAHRHSMLLTFQDRKPVSVLWKVMLDGQEVHRETLRTFDDQAPSVPFEFRLQMLGSGLTAFLHKDGLPQVIGQIDDLNKHLDLRRKQAIASYQTRLLTLLDAGSSVTVRQARGVLDTGVGLADLRAMTYEDGQPYLDRGRLWYTISIRGRQLPHHIQGVFSMDPSTFDLKLEGIILFDRDDGLLRNEIASHIFYDREARQWRGVTTGFTAFADPDEEKELWAVQSQKDPRFGISVMDAAAMDLVGDYEDAHVLWDTDAQKWRMLVSENHGGYKAVVRESDRWDGDYQRISGPIDVDSTGTTIQKIGDRRYCMFGSAARQLFVYSYPDLQPLGHLHMDLPPWSETSGTRVWANLVPLPEGYPSRYVLLTMDRFNFPTITGRNWSYGALYLYHGRRPDGDRHAYEYESR